jgi:hypothetical protein
MNTFFASGSFARSAALSSLSCRVERISAAMTSTAKSLLRKNPVMRYHALVAPVSIANTGDRRIGLSTPIFLDTGTRKYLRCPRPPVTAVKRSRKKKR